MEPNDIGIQFHPLARPESFRNIRRGSSIFAPLMNFVFLRLLDLMRWEIWWMTLGLYSIDIYPIA
jgi:hypothetical protein